MESRHLDFLSIPPHLPGFGIAAKDYSSLQGAQVVGGFKGAEEAFPQLPPGVADTDGGHILQLGVQHHDGLAQRPRCKTLPHRSLPLKKVR
jgi:hypothetical protein